MKKYFILFLVFIIPALAFANTNNIGNRVFEQFMVSSYNFMSEVTATYSPVGELNDYVGLTLKIVFDHPVSVSSGKIIVHDELDEIIEEVSANDPAILISDDKTTINYTPQNVRYGRFYVTIEAGAFYYEDATLGVVPLEGINAEDKTSWMFSVIDWVFDSSCLNIIEPEDGATDQPLDLKLILEFCSERIMAGRYGYLILAKQTVGLEGNSEFQYQILDSMITRKDGSSFLTVEVTGLEKKTGYSVTLSKGAIIDEGGNMFEGILSAYAWNFETGDFTSSEVSIISEYKSNGYGVVYPNPTTGMLQVTGLPQKEAVAIAVYNLAGQKLLEQTNTGTTVTVDLSSFKNGVYLVAFNGDMGKAVKVVKD